MIDILMTVYNGEQYVIPQIESILNQTDSNWKLFIQDDCSTDRTVELIEPYVRRYPERITLLRNEKNSGSAQKNFSACCLWWSTAIACSATTTTYGSRERSR